MSKETIADSHQPCNSFVDFSRKIGIINFDIEQMRKEAQVDTITPNVVQIDGDKLRRLREDESLSQRELSVRAGVSPATILKLETGRAKRPHPSTIRKLADALDVEPRVLRLED